jgi:hypothetical protein
LHPGHSRDTPHTRARRTYLDIEAIIKADAAERARTIEDIIEQEEIERQYHDAEHATQDEKEIPRPRPMPDSIRRLRAGIEEGFNPAAIDPEYRSPALTASFAKEDADENCHRYIKPDGTYGEQGLAIRKEIVGMGRSSNMREYFLNYELPQMNKLCPKFNTLQKEQKINFWIWYMAAISWDETKCFDDNWQVNKNATDTTAAGEFQMPAPWSHRDWRGPGCDAKEPPLNGLLMNNPANNIPCAVQTLAYGLCGFYSWNREKCMDKPQKPFGSNLYWSGAKRNDSKTMKMAKEFPLCK